MIDIVSCQDTSKLNLQGQAINSHKYGPVVSALAYDSQLCAMCDTNEALSSWSVIQECVYRHLGGKRTASCHLNIHGDSLLK